MRRNGIRIAHTYLMRQMNFQRASEGKKGAPDQTSRKYFSLCIGKTHITFHGKQLRVLRIKNVLAWSSPVYGIHNLHILMRSVIHC